MQAVERRLRSDVPVVSYISGGLDSTVVLGCCSRQRREPIPAFTIGFDRAGPDERSHATEAAAVLGSPLTTVTMDRAGLADAYPELIRAAEGRCSTPRARPCCDLAQSVHQQGYKVALTGEGADEALAGYVWYKAQAIRDAHHRPDRSSPAPSSSAGWPWGPWPAAGRCCRPSRPSAASGPPSRSSTNSSPRPSRRVYSAAMWERPGRSQPLRRPGYHQRAHRPLASAQPVALRRLQGHARGPPDDLQGRPDRDERLGRDALPVPRRRRHRVLRGDRPGVQAAGSDGEVDPPPGGGPHPPAADCRRPKTMFRASMSGTFLGPHRPAWVDQLLSAESLRATGYFDPAAVARQRAWQVANPADHARSLRLSTWP